MIAMVRLKMMLRLFMSLSEGFLTSLLENYEEVNQTSTGAGII